jgi:hypothetical protein
VPRGAAEVPQIMKIACSIDFAELENDDGFPLDSVCATCSRCGHETESFGTSDRSIRRCLVLMREECPERESNFYISEDSDDDH